MKVWIALLAQLVLAGCQQQDPGPSDAQRISLEGSRRQPAEPLASPDTTAASWRVSDNGQAIVFGKPGAPPLLTLACQVRASPPALRVIRHAPARPGEKALFPFLGNGTISRFSVDAVVADGEWRWQGELPATDPRLHVFTGSRELEATLPGAGTLHIAGSRIPAEFVSWCRTGGGAGRVQAAAQAQAIETPVSLPSPSR